MENRLHTEQTKRERYFVSYDHAFRWKEISKFDFMRLKEDHHIPPGSHGFSLGGKLMAKIEWS